MTGEEQWSVEQAKEHYAVSDWGGGYFDVNAQGEVVVRLQEEEGVLHAVSLYEVLREQRENGLSGPILLRFRSILNQRVQALHEAFSEAMHRSEYQGFYRGVYPIKVNQQRQVVEDVVEFGRPYAFGLEVGSKPELLIALAQQVAPESYVICNGYKDDAFISLALEASARGRNIILVIEILEELHTILDCAARLKIKPALGVRFRLSAKSEGHWAESGGDRSSFGLNTAQLMDLVDALKAQEALSCLQLLHYHQGSQLTNIRVIREACLEASQVYVNLVQEGAPMQILDLGGGLGVHYGGNQSNVTSSCNYGLSEYATDLVEIIQQVCDTQGVPHPIIMTESGRALVAQYSVLVFDIIGESSLAQAELPPQPTAASHEMLKNLWEIQNRVSSRAIDQLQECFNDALFYRDQIRSLFSNGVIDLRTRAEGEKIYWYTITQIAAKLPDQSGSPEALAQLQNNLNCFYYANFSIFQSLPDHWAIQQFFPVMPLQRLGERPNRKVILSDITCDCDGKVRQYQEGKELKNYLSAHSLIGGDPYLIGVFLVGAYQETLGDLHNLFGTPHVLSVQIQEGNTVITHEGKADTVAQVLESVQYDPDALYQAFQSYVQSEKSTVDQYQQILAGETYYSMPYHKCKRK